VADVWHHSNHVSPYFSPASQLTVTKPANVGWEGSCGYGQLAGWPSWPAIPSQLAVASLTIA